MPYMKEGKCVYHKNADGSRGELIKCHETEEQALAHLQALEINVPEAHEKTCADCDPVDTTAKVVAFGGAVKAIGDEGRVGGYLVMWGDSQNRDLQQEYFTKESDLALDWFDRRPVLYHHGLDKTVRAEKIGDITALQPDDTGLWMEAQIDMRHRYARAVLDLVKRGILGLSSGSLQHLVQTSGTGHIRFWPLIEGSLTPTPAEPRIQVIPLKSLEFLPGLEGLMATAAGESTEVASAEVHREGPVEDLQDEAETEEVSEMNIEQLVQGIVAQVTQKLGVTLSDEQRTALIQEVVTAAQQSQQQPAPAGTAAVASVDAAQIGQEVGALVVKAVMDIMNAQRAADTAAKTADDLLSSFRPQSAAPAGVRQPAGGNTHLTNYEVRTKYHDLSAEDMSFYHFLNGHRCRLRGFSPPVYEPEFFRELADKAGKSYNAGEIYAEPTAIKAMREIASKANEVENTLYATGGLEWVHTVWSDQLWEKPRMENPILKNLRMVQMPADTFTLPLESADATVYYVPQTTAEAELLISGAGAVIPDSLITTANVSITAKKLALRVSISAEEEEGSIIPFTAQARKQALRALQDAIDNVLLNGDDTASGNINLDGGTPGATAKYMAFEGILHLPIVTTAANALSAAGARPTLDMIRATRFLMAREYASKQSEIVYVTHSEVECQLLGLDEYKTIDKAGPRATNMTGALGEIDGSPVLYTSELVLSATNGKVSSTGGNNLYGRLAAIHLPDWVVGFRRGISASLSFLPYYDAYQLVATVRLGLTRRDADCASVLYYIKV